jgi:hypothetical protein
MSTPPFAPAFNELLKDQDGVVTTGSALKYMTGKVLECRVASGRWQQPCRGLVVTQSGPLTRRQELWVASLWAGRGSVLGGLSAARLGGFRGFNDDDEPIFVVKPPGQNPGRPSHR